MLGRLQQCHASAADEQLVCCRLESQLKESSMRTTELACKLSTAEAELKQGTNPHCNMWQLDLATKLVLDM